jgi:hypothetical protein
MDEDREERRKIERRKGERRKGDRRQADRRVAIEGTGEDSERERQFEQVRESLTTLAAFKAERARKRRGRRLFRRGR